MFSLPFHIRMLNFGSCDVIDIFLKFSKNLLLNVYPCMDNDEIRIFANNRFIVVVSVFSWCTQIIFSGH